MYFNITSAVYIDKYRINLTFNNGKSGIVDLAEYISDGEIFEPIRSIEIFKNFNVNYGTLTWYDDEIDIAPETLYEKSTGEKIVFDDSIQKVG